MGERRNADRHLLNATKDYCIFIPSANIKTKNNYTEPKSYIYDA